MKILFVNGCIRGESSRTLALAHCFLDAYTAAHPSCTLETADLNEMRLLPLFGDTLRARESAESWDDAEFAPARAFRDAGLIVLAAPFWEGTFPAAVHAYLEHICVTGLTFACTAQGYTGLCRAKQAVYITTRGGIYESGEAAGDNHAPAYLASIFRMLGIPELHMLAAEGLDILGADVEGILSAAKENAIRLAQMM